MLKITIEAITITGSKVIYSRTIAIGVGMVEKTIIEITTEIERTYKIVSYKRI